MPTTSNFGWTTPADTDLVKDGAAAIRTLGNGVDASFIDLKGGTTGQVLSKASNTDLDFTWTAGGDITEVQAGVGISVASGTGPIPVITNSSTDLITTAGDLLYGTAADTVARLGIGTASQVLAVNSGATAPEWITLSTGGMTLINTGGTTLSGASVTISSIPATYNELVVYVRSPRPATDGTSLKMRFNNDSNNRYSYGDFISASNQGFVQDGLVWCDDTDNGTTIALARIEIPQYANTATWKMYQSYSINADHNTPTNVDFTTRIGAYNQTAAITDLTFYPNSGNWTSGTVFVYGVK